MRGFIARYMGDGLLVHFGFPKAHEDDAERAVGAGLGGVDADGRLRDGHARFYEGHDTADLREARALLQRRS